MSEKVAPKPLSIEINDLLKGPSYPLELVTTKIGGMKAAFEENVFEFHFNRNGIKFWKCILHGKGCLARIVSKENTVYPLNRKHNHEKEPMVFVSTSKIVEEKSSETPADKIQAAEPPKEAVGGQELKMRLKQRFAALGRKLQKN